MNPTSHTMPSGIPRSRKAPRVAATPSMRTSSASSISRRDRVLPVNNTTPWLMIVRCQPTQGPPFELVVPRTNGSFGKARTVSGR